MATHKKTHVDALFQINAFVIATIVLLVIFYRPFMGFDPHDAIPKIENYTTTVALANEVEVGLTIHHFTTSDIIKDDICLDATIWFVYDPKKVTRDVIGQFACEEASIEKGVPVYIKQGDREIAYYPVVVRPKMNFDFRSYPLDDHQLWLTIRNDALPSDVYHFKTDLNHFTVEDRAQIHNCTTEKTSVQAGFVEQTLVAGDATVTITSSRAVFLLNCNPIDMRHFLNIFLPIYLIFFLTLFSFSFAYSEHTTDVPGIAAAGVPALFAYRFVIEAVSPDVSYFMISDYLFFLYLLLSLLVFLAVSWALNFSIRTKKYIIVSLYAIMLIGCEVIIQTVYFR